MLPRMRGFITITSFASALTLAACGGSSTPATTTTPEPAPVTEPTGDAEPAAASAEFVAQAEAGAAIYAESCAFCHGESGEGTGKSPAVVGDGALLTTNPDHADRPAFNTAADVLAYISETMPKDDPGSLSAEDYAAVTAFALKANGITADAKLTPESAASITISR